MWDATAAGIDDIFLAVDVQSGARGVIVLTDGEDNASAISQNTVRELAIDLEVPVFAIG